jgi:hypothetical protein
MIHACFVFILILVVIKLKIMGSLILRTFPEMIGIRDDSKSNYTIIYTD